MSVETIKIDQENEVEGIPNVTETETTPNVETENDNKFKNITLESFGFTKTSPAFKNTVVENNDSSVENNLSDHDTTPQGDSITTTGNTITPPNPVITEDDEIYIEETIQLKSGFCWLNKKQFEKITQNIHNLSKSSNNLDDAQKRKFLKFLKLSLNNFIDDNTAKNAIQKLLEPEKKKLRDIKKQNMVVQEKYKQQIQNTTNKIADLYNKNDKLIQNITQYENEQMNLKDKQIQLQQDKEQMEKIIQKYKITVQNYETQTKKQIKALQQLSEERNKTLQLTKQNNKLKLENKALKMRAEQQNINDLENNNKNSNKNSNQNFD